MSETRAAYRLVVTHDLVVGLAKQALCQNEACRVPLGEFVTWRGKLYIDTGAALLYAAHGVCKTCMQPYHYTEADECFQKMMRGWRRRTALVPDPTI